MSKTIENTLENKAKFFAMYFMQRVYNNSNYPEDKNILLDYALLSYPDKSEYLELKPLSSISDEDAEYCIGKTECSMKKNNPDSADYGMSPSAIFVNSIIDHSSYFIGRHEADYLRSKGYAVKWMDKTVKEQMDYGWIKLKED